MVAIRHWYGEMSFGLNACRAVSDILKGLDPHIGIPPETVVSVNGEVVGGEYVLRDGDTVVLARPPGRKGVGEIWTITEFATKAGVSVEEVELWIEQGLRVLRTSNDAILITETAVDCFVEREMKPPGTTGFGALAATPAPDPLVPQGAAPARPKPEWNFVSGELLWNGEVIRKYGRQPADKQIGILNAFQTAGWDESIPNPTVEEPPPDRPAKKSAKAAAQKNLGSAIRALNKKLKKGTIMFRAVRGGRIAWEPVNATVDNKSV